MQLTKYIKCSAAGASGSRGVSPRSTSASQFPYETGDGRCDGYPADDKDLLRIEPIRFRYPRQKSTRYCGNKGDKEYEDRGAHGLELLKELIPY
jgi:hypothetical protein